MGFGGVDIKKGKFLLVGILGKSWFLFNIGNIVFGIVDLFNIVLFLFFVVFLIIGGYFVDVVKLFGLIDVDGNFDFDVVKIWRISFFSNFIGFV